MRLTRGRLALAAALGAGAALGAEWMRHPSWILAAGLAGLAAAAGLIIRFDAPGRAGRAGRVAILGVVLLAVLAIAALLQTRKLGQLAGAWPAVREAAITRASDRLGGELDDAVALARRLAESAAAAAGSEPVVAFGTLARALERRAVLHGVTLFATAGNPVAWAGAQRLELRPAGPELEAVTTPFYLWLVARRQTTSGTAVATVLLSRQNRVPRAGESLSERFAASTGVGLRFLDHRLAPSDSGVFDYVVPGSRGHDTLFAVRPVPPDQGTVTAERLAAARRTTVVLVVVMLLCLARLAAREPGLPFALLPPAAAVIVLARAPLRDAFGPGYYFWPDTYYSAVLGPLSASAGVLAITGLLAAMLAGRLWRHGLAPRPASWVIAALGSVTAPYLVQDLARGITPPPGGTPVMQWLAWQGALTLTAGAIVLLAAALVRGRAEPRSAGFAPLAAGLIALVCAVAGLWLWDPVEAWPDWYPYLWVPALLLAIRPMPFRYALATIAIVAGSAAALLTWGASAEGRMALAQRDLEGLGERADPVAISLLDQVAQGTVLRAPPASAGELFIWWAGTPLGAQRYPAELDVWRADGTRTLSLALADLDMPADTVLAVVARAFETGAPRVRAVLRLPGLHGVAALPLSDGSVLTVTVGPRSRLLPPTRLARLLAGSGEEPEPPYEIAIAPPGVGDTASQVQWVREGWLVRAERSLVLPDGEHHAHAMIDLGGPASLFQRGVLVLAFDVALLLGLWLLIEFLAGRLLPAVRAALPRARRSLRWRLTVSLALFFLAPTVAFAMWSYGRLEAEFRGARALLLQRTLRDAAAVLPDRPALVTPGTLDEAARRFDALLALAGNGRVTTVTAPVLLDFGLLDRYVAGGAYVRLAHGDETEVSADQPNSPIPTLVGYRLLARGADSSVILAAPEFLSDPALRRREADLGIAVLVATLAGFLASLVLAGLGARALARPLQQLRLAALSVGSGEPPRFDDSVPVELEPIAAALSQAAADVERGQRAQRVLAWGEMARQVAHEIKNPLTPIRLGIQHLLRIQKEKPAELETVLSGTGERILAEIDRLDAIARTFSRFALPGEGVPLEPVPLEQVVHDVLHLYGMGESPVEWRAEVAEGLVVHARRDELVEVLVNLCENSRDAGAAMVTVRAAPVEGGVSVEVIDDGRGIAPEVLPRVFEPRFSTTTSGSGLGLAISRRLVESWGGSITVESRPGGAGTVATLALRSAA